MSGSLTAVRNKKAPASEGDHYNYQTNREASHAFQ